MKNKVLIWSLLGIVCVTAFAKSSHAKPSTPAPAPVAPRTPVPSVAPVVPATAVVPAAHVQNPGNYIALHSGYGIHSSSLTGTGFNSDLSGAMGLIYGAEISHQSADTGIRYSLKYEKASADQEAPAGVTPTDISVLREEFRFVASLPVWNSGGGEDLRLGVGYSFLQTGATDTLPNNVMTKQTSQGVILNASYQVKINPEWSAGTEVLLYLPHKVQESPQVTGYNANFVGAEIKFLVDYTFSEQLVGFIGASYRTDHVTYEGTVDRGVTDGQDSRTLFAIPVGLKIGY